MNATTNLRTKLVELVEEKDMAVIRLLLIAYQGQWRHEQTIRLALAKLGRTA